MVVCRTEKYRWDGKLGSGANASVMTSAARRPERCGMLASETCLLDFGDGIRVSQSSSSYLMRLEVCTDSVALRYAVN